MKKNYISIDIGGTELKYARMDETGKILSHSSVPVADSLDGLLDEIETVSSGKENMDGIAISAPGHINARTGYFYTGGALVFLNETDFGRMVEERMHCPVSVINDAKAAGYAELYETDTQDGHEELCFYLMLSNSVGGAIINNSEIYLGYNGRSAEIGHVRIVPDGKECYCGQKGCVNAYCSAKILSQETDGELEVFFNELEKGNEKYRQLFREYLRYLAITIINIRMICDGLIIVGGYVGAYMKDYMEDLKKMCAKLDPYSNSADYLKPCSFTHDASAVGAALYFVGDFINNL